MQTLELVPHPANGTQIRVGVRDKYPGIRDLFGAIFGRVIAHCPLSSIASSLASRTLRHSTRSVARRALVFLRHFQSRWRPASEIRRAERPILVGQGSQFRGTGIVN